MTSCAWIWMYAGAVLMLLELLAPGFVVFFFGLSAATVGLLRFVFGARLTLAGQLAAFSVFAVLYLAVLRRWLKGVFAGTSRTSAADFDSDYIGRTGVVTEAVTPPRTGRVLVGDAEWTAAADAPLAVGAEVRVVAQTNLTLRLAPL